MTQQLFKKLSLLLLSVFFASCSMEEDYIQKQNSAQQAQDFKISLLTKSEIHKRTSLTTRINRISRFNRSNGLNKVVYDSIYDFYIDTDQALLIENDSLTSYTFSVVRPEQEIQTENLVIQTKNDSTVVYLVDYQEDLNVVKNMTAEEAMALNTLFYELNGTADRCSVTIICKDIYTYEYGIPCNQGNNTGGQVYCEGWVYQGSSCTLAGCGGGDSNSDENTNTIPSTDTSTGGSNPDPDEEEIVTTPLPVLEEDLSDDPCDKIKEGTSSAAYKQKFKDLNTPENYALDHETGFFEKEINGVKQYVDGVPDGTSHLNTPEDAMNGTHVHNNILKTYEGTNLTYDAQIKILSPGDLVNLIKLMQNNNLNPTNTFTVMISNEGIFAIMLQEPIAWTIELRDKIFEFSEYYATSAKKMVDNYTNMTETSRKNYLTKMLLKGLKKYNLEGKVNLFEGEIENEADTNIDNYNIKWTQKKLKNTFLGYDIDSIPCN